MEKFDDELGLAVAFRPANPLADSDPPLPPLHERTVLLEKGSVHAEGAYPLPCDIVVDQDVPIPLRTGAVLRGDVYRPATSDPAPVILVYTPYGKRDGWPNAAMYVSRFGVPADHLSGLQAFEAPDPGFWCAEGYAIAVVDTAGTGHSGGDEVFHGTQSGRNAHDVIEWLAAQDWCNGKVGMAGNSQLAMVQWQAAAQQPPHLAAIAPWEGEIDIYRESMVRGGIPDTVFHDEDVAVHIYGENDTEDVTAHTRLYPLVNAYWADKRADLTRITVPAYIVGSWTNGLHTHGTFQAFREISSTDKWLRVHNIHEWTDLADLAQVRDLRRFFDRYLKDIDNGWEDTQRVRLTVLDPGGTDLVGRPEDDWPLARQQWRTMYLDAASGTLGDKPSETEALAEYRGDDDADSVVFTTSPFEHDTEITGYAKLRLWVETPDAEDMDLFAAVHKVDQEGYRQYHLSLPAGPPRPREKGQPPAGMAYVGPLGQLRASHRALDPDRSTPSEPYLTHAAEEPLTPGVPVPVEIALWPTSMVVHPGERLVVEVAGHPIGPPTRPGGQQSVLATRNLGLHRIRTGGDHDSHLLLPVVP
ncbi:CocE/NonD family hydrolase [Streptomyces europaeiscabiei]|uniref:CocE/NonD family hydrolase n=1 Tax=Streptomyces europaeiscabiei TaxID=146819 RepID=UPI002E2ABAE5|nr:CocE/NonD family hydrolase [Streptomyces europaeiscabiei]